MLYSAILKRARLTTVIRTNARLAQPLLLFAITIRLKVFVRVKNYLTGLAAIASLAVATPALADPITLDSSDVGQTFTIDFDGFVEATQVAVANLTSAITFTLTSASATQYMLDYTVANTSSDGVASRVSSFAFNTNPSLTSATSTGAYPFTFVADGSGSDPSYPNGIGAVDVCFKAKSSGSCSNGDGVVADATGSGTINLNFSGGALPLTLSDFFVRYQGISGAGNVSSASGQSVTTTTTTSGGTSSGTQVPAPGMLGLLGLALVSLGLMRRRRQKAGADSANGREPSFA